MDFSKLSHRGSKNIPIFLNKKRKQFKLETKNLKNIFNKWSNILLNFKSLLPKTFSDKNKTKQKSLTLQMKFFWKKF